MTWFQLWEKIGRQPLYITQHKDVRIKIDNIKYKCKIVYDDNGNDWYLVID